MSRHSYIAVFCAVIFVVSCRKDRPEETNEPFGSIGSSGGVYIVNEGNFQFGNASVSYYDKTANQCIEDVYQPANSAALGDVCQSMIVFNGKAYLVINNSQKIEVVDPVDFVQSGTITGFVSPRHVLPVSNSKAYVTDLFSNAVSVVDLPSLSITGSIPINGWTEELALAYGKVYVTNQQSDKLYVINSATDILEDSIAIGYGSNSIREDKNGKLWVLCGGNSALGINASLHRVNPLTGQVEQNFQFQSPAASPWRLRMNGTLDTLYFLDDDVYRMPVTAGALPQQYFISGSSHIFYGLGIDPVSREVYIADAVDYVQRGMIYRYKSDGTMVTSFLAGVIPGDFWFQ